MKTSRLPIAIQQAVMRSLREKLAQANLKLERQYPEPKAGLPTARNRRGYRVATNLKFVLTQFC